MTPAQLQELWEVALFGLLLWREARNQTDDVIRAVASSVCNRVLSPRWWGHSWQTVILHPKQYSSFNHDDPNAAKIPIEGDQAFARCLQIAAEVHGGLDTDHANGTQSYFDKSLDAHPPNWAIDGSMEHVFDAGAFHFYRVRENNRARVAS